MNTPDPSPVPSQEGLSAAPCAADLALAEKLYDEAHHYKSLMEYLACAGWLVKERVTAAVVRERAQAWIEYDKKLATQYLRGERDEEMLKDKAIAAHTAAAVERARKEWADQRATTGHAPSAADKVRAYDKSLLESQVTGPDLASLDAMKRFRDYPYDK